MLFLGNNAAARKFAKSCYFTDCASTEFSRDAEMMRGGYFDNYFIQMVYNIQRLEGTAPIIVQDSRKPADETVSPHPEWPDSVDRTVFLCYNKAVIPIRPSVAADEFSKGSVRLWMRKRTNEL